MRAWFGLGLGLLLAGCASGSEAPSGGELSGGTGGTEAGGSAGAAGAGAAGLGGASPYAANEIICEGKTKKVCDGQGGFSKEEECDKGCVAKIGCAACAPTEATCANGVSTYCRQDSQGYEEEACDPDMGLACGDNGRCVGDCSRATLGRSYIGCEYWPTVTSNSGLYHGFSFAIAVTNTGTKTAKVKVVRAGQEITSQSIEPGALQTIKLPWVDSLKTDTPQGQEPSFKSIGVVGGAYQVKSDQPVTVYQFNPLEFTIPNPGDCPDQLGNGSCNSFTNDASLLLPSNSLAYEYIVVSAPTLAIQSNVGVSSQTPGFVSITATQDSTQVTVTAKGSVRGGGSIPAIAAGGVQSLKLNKGDVVQLFSDDAPLSSLTGCKTLPRGDGTSLILCSVPHTYDLSGTQIVASKTIQVIGGHDCTFMPATSFACDHIEESLFPVTTWGTEVLVTAPQAVAGAAAASGLPDPQIVRVFSGADNNAITLDPPLFPGGTLNKGEYADVPMSDKDFVVKGTGPILVAQYMLGASLVDPGATGNSKGDPSLSLAVPSAQFRTSYSFLAPDSYTYNFVNVITEKTVVPMLDGAAVGGTPSAIGSTNYQVTRLPVAGGAHLISAEKPFGIVVYGYGDYTSYMYPGGLDLNEIDIK